MTTRLVDLPRKRELDKLIKQVRRMYMARAKLGAFDKMYADCLEETRLDIPCRKSASFYDALQKVKTDDLESFRPLVNGIGDYFGYWRLSRNDIKDHRRLFDGYVRYSKEKALRELGIVTYK